MPSSRRTSRIIALQFLFALEYHKGEDNFDRDALFTSLKEETDGTFDEVFINKIIDGVLNNKQKLDKIIDKASENWGLDKISIINKNIIRIGLYEILFGKEDDVPEIVAINEAIELTRIFSNEGSVRFINGLLGTIYKELREPGKKSHPGVIVKKAVGGLIFIEEEKEKKYLLVYDKFNKWTLPKGSIETKEDESKAVVKKIKEKLDVDVKIEDEIGRNSYLAYDPDEGKVRKEVIYYLMETKSDKVNKNPSYTGISNFSWFTIKEMKELKIYKDIIKILERTLPDFK